MDTTLIVVIAVVALFAMLLLIAAAAPRRKDAKSPSSSVSSVGCVIIIGGGVPLLLLAGLLLGGKGYLGEGAQQAIIGWMGGSRYFNLSALITANQRYEAVELLDTDADGELERVLLYRYDLVGGRSPLGATVLDLDADRPRGIDSQILLPMDQDYLSELRYEIEMRDIPELSAKPKLLVWGKTPDNVKTDLTIFEYSDMLQPTKPPELMGQRGYRNLGSFRGTGGIVIQGNAVRVYDRAFERSQLAVVNVFLPQDGNYRNGQDGPMRPKYASAIEFAFGAPGAVEQTYYPEKTVVAFYLNIGQKTAEAKALLDPLVVGQYIQDSYGKDVAEPGQLTSMAEVKEIAYVPDAGKERAHGEIAVEVELLNRRPDGSFSDRLHRYRVWVKGFPNPKAAPFGAEWRIVKFEPLS